MTHHQPPPDSAGRAAVARAIAKAHGDDFDKMPKNKSDWTRQRGEFGGRYRDINEPFQTDYLDMADAAIEALASRSRPASPAAPEYQRRPSYTPADPAEVRAHIERLRRDVIPAIEEEQRRKHSPAAEPVPVLTAVMAQSILDAMYDAAEACGVAVNAAPGSDIEALRTIACGATVCVPAPPAPAGVDALLREARGALLDYVDTLERQGGSMFYGRSIIARIDAFLKDIKE